MKSRICSLFLKPIKLIKLFLFIILSSISLISYSQIEKEWGLNFPSGSDYYLNWYFDSDFKILEDNDGNLIFTGKSTIRDEYSIGDMNIYKITPKGELLWKYKHETDDSLVLSSTSFDFEIDSENNIIIGGKSVRHFENMYHYSETSDFLLLKISTKGELLWQQIIRAEDYQVNYCRDLVIDNKDNIFTLGRIYNLENPITSIYKFNKNGTLIWDTDINEIKPININLIHNNLHTITANYGDSISYYIVDTSSNILNKLFFKGNLYEYRTTFKMDKNQNYYIWENPYVIKKYNSNSELLWEYNGKEGNKNDKIYDCYIDEEENVYITGMIFPQSKWCDLKTIKLDKNGNLVWKYLYDNDGFFTCQNGIGIFVNNNDHTYIFGHNSSIFAENTLFDGIILELNSKGKAIDSIFNFSNNNTDNHISNFLFKEDCIYVSGWSMNSEKLYEYKLVKYKIPKTSLEDEYSQNLKISIFPNPTNNIVQINFNNDLIQNLNINIYNVKGVLKAHYKNISVIDISTFESGSYIIELKNKDSLIHTQLIFKE